MVAKKAKNAEASKCACGWLKPYYWSRNAVVVLECPKCKRLYRGSDVDDVCPNRVAKLFEVSS